MPVVDRELTGDQRGAPPAAVLDHLEQIAPLPIAEGSQAPIIEDEQIGFRERCISLLYEPSLRATASSPSRRGRRT